MFDFLADGCLSGLLDFLIRRTPWRLFVWLVVVALAAWHLTESSEAYMREVEWPVLAVEENG